MKTVSELRAGLAAARRVVVKIGSRVLIGSDGRPDLARFRALAADLSALRARGAEVVVVSSGAIGTGVHALGLKSRPRELPDLQMAAAVGQSRLMAIYDKVFGRRNTLVGQVLLTYDDLKNRRRHLNARSTIMNMLRNGIVPVINENDAVSTEEIKFGDNDQLASLVALLIQADLLVILTTVEGFLETAPGGKTRRVSYLSELTPEVLAHAQGKGSDLSVGGMASKLHAAYRVARVGAPVVIANGRRPRVVSRIAAGADIGTMLAHPTFAGQTGALDGRKLWIGYFQQAEGALVVDDGAREALVAKGRSLLPVGVRAVEGHFEAGALLEIKDARGTVVARGLTEFASRDIRKIMGHHSPELRALLGSAGSEEVVHRDNLAVI